MKLALQRKASKKLVDRKEEVITLVRRVSEVQPTNVAEAVSELRMLEEAADELGLPLTGDEWGERLTIKKKGGGVHFDDEVRATAATAFERANVLHSAVTWHEQLGNRAAQITSAVGAFRTKGGAGAALSKNKMLDKCTELLGAATKTLGDIFSDCSYRSTIAKMERLGVPQQLQKDGDALRTQLLLLSEFAHEIAQAELKGLRSEKKLTQRFRAPQTLAVLSAAEQLMRAVDTAARPTAFVEPEDLAALSEAIVEVRPMAGSAAAGQADEELDDEI